jgi:hypothetical protein
VTAAETAATAHVSAAATASALGKSGMSSHQEYDECSKEPVHCSSARGEGKDGAELEMADCRWQID